MRRRHRETAFWRPLLVLSTAVAVGVASVGTANATPTPAHSGAGSERALVKQLQQAYDSANGQQARSMLASMIADPALPTLATSLLQQASPSGTNNLTAFQTDMLKEIQLAARHSTLFTAVLTGQRLTRDQGREFERVRDQFTDNPAFRAYAAAGRQLSRSTQFPADISAAVASDSQSFATLTPPPSVDQGGSAALDTLVDDVATWRTSSAFAGYDSTLTTALADPALTDLIRDQGPVAAAGFLPPQQLAALIVPADQDPLTPIQKDEFNLLGLFFTATAALVTFAFFTPPGLLVAGTVLLAIALLAVASFTVPVADQFAQDLDCDGDGDPFDQADGTPSDPCPAPTP